MAGWKHKKTPIIVGNENNPTKMESGQVIINKKATKQNLDRLIEINEDGSESTSEKVTTDGTDGGLLKGKPHYDKNGKPLGGIPVVVDGSKNIEVEGNEFVVNKEASQKHWKELSKINQSAGNGVPINPSDVGADDDPMEYKEGGRIIDFNPNHLPRKDIYNYAKMVKTKYPKVWDLGGNIFGNEAFNNLERVLKRGYWTENEEWMYIKWRSYVARHKQDFRIAGVIAMLKWVDKVDKGWSYMKALIEKEIDKKYPKKKTGGNIDNNLNNDKYEKFKENNEKSQNKNIENAISYISRGITAIKEKQPRGFSKNELKNLELQLVFEFAKNNNLWIDNINSLPLAIDGGGNENSLYYDEKNGIIYKSNNLFNNDFSILKYLKYILNHNILFENTKYKLEGFNGFSNNYENNKNAIPYVEPVVSQKFIVGNNATENEIKEYMQSLGYENMGEHTYQNNNFIISDLRPRNVLKDTNGKIYVIDNIIKEKDLNYQLKTGGSVTYKQKYNKKYGYDSNETHDLSEVAKDTGVSEKGLQQIYNKGVGAYKTNPESVRPNVKSKEQWAMGRVYSAVMGGKAAKIDANELKMDTGGATSWEKMISASSRFRPYETITFEPPLIGKNGAKLTSYTWAYEMTMQPNWEGELVGKRVSDWTQAEISAETGRGIVHRYTVELPDGSVKVVSSESVPILMGYVDRTQAKVFGNLATASKTLAKQQMKLAILEAQKKEYDELYAKFEKAQKPEITLAEISDLPLITQKVYQREVEQGKGVSFTYFKMGDVIYSQDNNYNYNEGKYIQSTRPDNRTIEQLTSMWISERVKEAGGINPRGLYDLKNRVERQKRKVEQMLKSPKMEDGGNLYHLGGDMSKHLAPNGKPSNLTHEQWHLVRTPEFKAWFGDWENDPATASKVVDENGEPLVVYHGTDKFFNEFKIADVFRKDWGVRDYGAYFSSSILTAKEYSLEKIKENQEYLDWQNKLDELKTNQDWENWMKLYEHGKDKYKPNKPVTRKSVRVIECFLNIKNPFLIDGKGKHWFSVLKGLISNEILNSNDGMIVSNIIEVFNDIQDTFIAFYPTQIKLADGSNTTFDRNNPDVRFEDGGNVESHEDLESKIYKEQFGHE